MWELGCFVWGWGLSRFCSDQLHSERDAFVPQVSYCPALTSLVCFLLRVGFLEGETAAMVQASIDRCARASA